jgi:outer membrane autotransporter protein
MFLTYDPNHVYLEIRRNDTDFASLCGRGTFNQCEVAKTLDSFDPETPPSADIGTMVEQVTGMDEDTALAAFDRMSGEVHPSLAGIVLEGHALYGQTVTRRMAERREAIGADRLRGGSWVRAYGASSELDGDGNAHAADWNLRGLAAGYDAWGTENWLVGAALNVMRLDARFRPGDRGEVDSNNVSLYTSFQGERAYLDAVGSYAWWDNETTRAVDVGDIHRIATAKYRTHRFAGYLEAGWTFNVGDSALLQPLLSLQYDNLASQGFREQGAQDLSLIARSDSVERMTLGTGLRWSNTSRHGDWTLEPTAQVRWLHTEGQGFAEFDVAFSGAPDEGYRLPEFGWRVRGVTAPQDRGLLGLGLAARKDNVDLFLDYDFQAGDGFKSHNLSAGLRYRW